MIDESLIKRFLAIVGEGHALQSDEEKAPYLTEWRDRYQGQSDLVLLPGSTGEVAEIVRIAAETETPLVPQGGNTGLVGGQIPGKSGREVVVSLKRMNKIRCLAKSDCSMVAEAGASLAAVQTAAEDVGLLFPLSLASEGSAQVGGAIASNAGGVAVLKYGMMRDLLFGLEVVLANGEVWHGLKSLHKDNTGYDLKSLFAGSEGTLGIITAASLKLFPAPACRLAAFAGLSSLQAVGQLFERARAVAGPGLSAFEMISERGLRFSQKFIKSQKGADQPLMEERFNWYVLLELEGDSESALQSLVARLLEGALEAGVIGDAVISSSEAQRQVLWQIREVLSEAQKPEGGSIKHDVSVPVAAIPAFINEANGVVERLIPGARPVPFGHFGDGNIHYNISQPRGADKEAFLDEWERVNDAVYEVVIRHGGSISAEHGIGVMKRDLLARVKSKQEMAMMQAIKAALDPKGIMNPGKVI